MIKPHDSLIVQQMSRILIPIIQVFAVYVLTHGHYSPGGGFQAGLLIGASIILRLLVGKSEDFKKISILNEFLYATFGVFLFTIVGVLAISEGSQFFDYGVIKILGETAPERRYWGIFVAEIGVAFAVAFTLAVIFHALVVSPDLDEKKAS